MPFLSAWIREEAAGFNEQHKSVRCSSGRLATSPSKRTSTEKFRKILKAGGGEVAGLALEDGSKRKRRPLDTARLFGLPIVVRYCSVLRLAPLRRNEFHAV
jgi:hypothetical protein